MPDPPKTASNRTIKRRERRRALQYQPLNLVTPGPPLPKFNAWPANLALPNFADARPSLRPYLGRPPPTAASYCTSSPSPTLPAPIIARSPVNLGASPSTRPWPSTCSRHPTSGPLFKPTLRAWRIATRLSTAFAGIWRTRDLPARAPALLLQPQ